MMVFLDTEFTNLHRRQLISIGLVSLCGRHSFYREVQGYNFSICSDFVKEAVLPHLKKNPDEIQPMSGVRASLLEWLKLFSGNPLTVAVDHIYDWELFRNLLGEVPDWITMADIGNSVDNIAFEVFFRDHNLKQHHALNDALANRHGFLVAQAEFQKMRQKEL